MKRILFLIALFSINAAWTQPYKVFFGNLHSHTSYSDGSSTPDEAYKYAKTVAKIDFLAVTEHNHAKAKSKILKDPLLYSGTAATSLKSAAKRYNQDNKFVAIYGQEFSTIGSGNHANVFEIDSVIRPTLVPNGSWDRLFNEFLPRHKDAQGRLPLLLLNHPAIAGSPEHLEYGRDDFDNFDTWLNTLDKYAELINIVNGPSHEAGKPAGKPSEGEFLRYLNLGLHVAPTADQDNHLKNWGAAASPRTGVITTSLTKENIMNALRARNVYATQDKNLSVIATVNGQLIGSIIAGSQVPSNGSALAIELKINDTDEPDAEYTIDIYTDVVGGEDKADVIHEQSFTGNGTMRISDVKYTGGRQYLFIKITQTDEEQTSTDYAWLAPVWFEPGTAASASTGTAVTTLTLSVNEMTEEAQIANVGNSTVNLHGYKLVSVIGNQVFEFTTDAFLQPGRSLIITSGPNARNAGNRIRWTDKYIWTNTGDPGKLLDKDGKLIAQTDNE